MKIPEKPPSSKIEENEFDEIKKYLENNEYRQAILDIYDRYLYWSELKHKTISQQIKPEILWKITKIQRNSHPDIIKLSDIKGFEFKYNLTSYINKKLHEFDLNLGGKLEGDIIPEENKKQYLIDSIMEEAIASSQLEGAVTTREHAKSMLRQERKPGNRSEQMILNNYNTIKKIKPLKNKKLTSELILEIHASITKDTLDDPDNEGKYRATNDISVVNVKGDIVYHPPDHQNIEHLMNEFCHFANESDEIRFVHPIIRACILHFLIGYIHPFVDGNGRTARAIFYWYLLSRNYWLIEYMSISRIIIKSRAQYARAYLFTEFDENDLTYFIKYQLKTTESAFQDLKNYIAQKIQEKTELYDFRKIKNINERQIYILKYLSDNPKFTFTIKEMQNKFNTAYETARKDILYLQDKGLLEKTTSGKKKLVYYRSKGFDEIIEDLIQ
ncbi:MAG: DeoR family transcriptional regulator [Candidatus Methanoperedens sp.]|nr:DeoR family transcriptional regulator [Candidatus Methanoperedens sp.]